MFDVTPGATVMPDCRLLILRGKAGGFDCRKDDNATNATVEMSDVERRLVSRHSEQNVILSAIG